MQATKALKNALRNPYAWPGGYTVGIYFADGERICPKCARAEYRQIAEATRNPSYRTGWEFGFIEIYWEGPPENCVQCNADLPSEYGDPDQEGD